MSVSPFQSGEAAVPFPACPFNKNNVTFKLLVILWLHLKRKSKKYKRYW